MIVTTHPAVVGDYHYHRKRIYEPIRDTFSWDIWNGQEYALASFAVIDQTWKTEIELATKLLGNIFVRVAEVVRLGSEELWRELGYPPETWRAISLSTDYKAITTIGRFDFAYTSDGLKMLEFNSDTPTSIVEAFYVNEEVCRYYQVENMNDGTTSDIKKAFTDIVDYYRQKGHATKNIVFCCDSADDEDQGTTKYLLKQSGLSGIYSPILHLAYDPNTECLVTRLADGEYRQVDVLYRLHALEMMAKDRTTKGFPIGSKLLELVAKKRLTMINPPSGFIAQTKALQALIWNLYESNIFFSAEEREVISTYCLPTYLENQFRGEIPYVKKPFFGREGGAVSIYDADGTLETADIEKYYWDQPMVYQTKVELPAITVETSNGLYTGKLLLGSFLVGGKPSAVIGRVDKGITHDMSYFLPLALK
ncbi:glutathionylspermidine synthase family protein [Shimazuella sp. AN120528]|uniref:glutathionylspermidine synthase family protein n=1 Tax=Shimazuella soli TaxID=1892854 RepID=UPI001F1059FB|nr:glutathionylspermidine synthase family protein [Shimazuella soli]MCH5585301.1 glutathionylspermidine synthase family protein [Shimazuella soli]